MTRGLWIFMVAAGMFAGTLGGMATCQAQSAILLPPPAAEFIGPATQIVAGGEQYFETELSQARVDREEDRWFTLVEIAIVASAIVLCVLIMSANNVRVKRIEAAAYGSEKNDAGRGDA